MMNVGEITRGFLSAGIQGNSFGRQAFEEINMEHDHQSKNRKEWFNSKSNWALLAFLIIAGFYLITEHKAHVFGLLPFLILLACPLLHMFMHHGHGGRGNDSPPESRNHGNQTGDRR